MIFRALYDVLALAVWCWHMEQRDTAARDRDLETQYQRDRWNRLERGGGRWLELRLSPS